MRWPLAYNLARCGMKVYRGQKLTAWNVLSVLRYIPKPRLPKRR